jgi:hypothetical protein
MQPKLIKSTINIILLEELFFTLQSVFQIIFHPKTKKNIPKKKKTRDTTILYTQEYKLLLI